MKCNHLLPLVSNLLLGSLLSINSYAHELIVNVDNITQKKGVMMIALYNSINDYQTNNVAFSGQKIAVIANTLTIKFGDMPSGEYAITLFHDENENGVLDKNLLGIPTEGYGFSNNRNTMGQPDFAEAKFDVNDNTIITIHLR